MTEHGYLFLHRKVMESDLWGLSSRHIMVAEVCLMKANWETRIVRGIEVKRGQWLTHRKEIASLCPPDVTERVVRRALRNLGKGKLGFLVLEVVLQAGRRYLLITICKYNDYQTPSGAAVLGAVPEAVPSRSLGGPMVVPTLTEEVKEVEELKEGKTATSSSTSRPKLTIPVEEIRSYWNSKGVLPMLRHIQGTRLTHLRARWALSEFRDHWREAIDAICRDSFCLGDGPVREGYSKPWRASFKWFVANDDNWCSRWEREITQGIKVKRSKEQIEAEERARLERIEREESEKRGDLTPAGKALTERLSRIVAEGKDEGSE